MYLLLFSHYTACKPSLLATVSNLNNNLPRVEMLQPSASAATHGPYSTAACGRAWECRGPPVGLYAGAYGELAMACYGIGAIYGTVAMGYGSRL